MARLFIMDSNLNSLAVHIIQKILPARGIGENCNGQVRSRVISIRDQGNMLFYRRQQAYIKVNQFPSLPTYIIQIRKFALRK